MSEQELDYSYKVLEALVLGMRKVKADPRRLGRFFYEYVEKLPDIMDALELLVSDEHLGVVGELLKASGEMAGECLIALTK